MLDESNSKIADDYFKWERDNLYYKKRYTLEELMNFEAFRIEAAEWDEE